MTIQTGSSTLSYGFGARYGRDVQIGLKFSQAFSVDVLAHHAFALRADADDDACCSRAGQVVCHGTGRSARLLAAEAIEFALTAWPLPRGATFAMKAVEFSAMD